MLLRVSPGVWFYCANWKLVKPVWNEHYPRMKNGRTGVFFPDQMNHFKILCPGKIKSWVTVSWLKMHLFGLNVSAMQFVGVSASARSSPPLPSPPRGWGALTLRALGTGRADIRRSAVTELARASHWKRKKGQELREGDSSALQSSSSSCPDGRGRGCPMAPALPRSAHVVPVGNALALPLTPCSYLAYF